MHNVLVIEADDHTLRDRGDELLLDGLEVYVASSRQHAAAHLAQVDLHAIVLGALDDPAESLALLRDLRSGEIPGVDTQLPVIAIGADADHAAVRLYLAGADITLPSTASPLLIKGALDALAKRTDAQQHRRVMRVGHLSIDCDARVATVSGAPVSLTRLEFDLLQTLARDPHRVFAKTELARDVWGYDPTIAGIGRSVDGHASRLRHKLRAAGPDELVQTVRGVGYRLTR
jgi:DNA-binding response OmpR family regulator